ncbi:MAG: hypothetical protein UU12_C0017G0017 [Candidatus Woesebacteria bacterium GW2011_GWA2_40_7b]|uniref:Putative membrane protein insertion efficiency factor n=1 Tax=Candidatus Woesebacteria bacterium GW2011_GWA2_40_7b TaxID=1618563 RepID=A0A0G0T7N1_9BACT|nr:MAG: hypothetical protein UU12_C0017G0017 [Candidatus Woesebacteria bacterium GW2011_GWA2_40_7b]KKR92113.1 MAG: hypothetical protein UU44_C0009G0005 [Candidatus Daviesbacteria bacterium GW2011_GWB1_41_15]
MKHLLSNMVRLYRKLISPVLVLLFGKACRFTPTCSEYTIEALEKLGVMNGLTISVRRFLRCHPWGGFGYDPVPSLNKQISK